MDQEKEVGMLYNRPNEDIEIHYAKNKTVRHWILFVVFTIITALFLLFFSEFFWVPLPFMLTYLVLALKVI